MNVTKVGVQSLRQLVEDAGTTQSRVEQFMLTAWKAVRLFSVHHLEAGSCVTLGTCISYG